MSSRLDFPMRRSLLRVLFLMPLLSFAASHAQVVSPALTQATSVDAALGAIGASKSEPSTYLLLDMPEVAPAGKVRATMASELAGTAWLVLLRGRRGASAPLPPGETPQPVLLGAWPFKAGAAARATLSLELQASESFTLLALTRGRWFSVEREVKLGVPPAVSRAAKDARARKVEDILARPEKPGLRQAVPNPSLAASSPTPAAVHR